MFDDYVCRLIPVIDSTVLFDFAIYLKYTNSKNKDIFEKDFDIKITINSLKKIFGNNFLYSLTDHLLSCHACNKELKKQDELTKEILYICPEDKNFNNTTIQLFIDYKYSLNKELELELKERFGDSYDNVIRSHLQKHKECLELYKILDTKERQIRKFIPKK